MPRPAAAAVATTRVGGSGDGRRGSDRLGVPRVVVAAAPVEANVLGHKMMLCGAAAAAAAASAVVIDRIDGGVRSVELTAQGFGGETLGEHRRRRTPRPRVPRFESLRTSVRDGGGAAAAAAAAAADRRSARSGDGSRRKRHRVHALERVSERLLLLLRRGTRVVVLGWRVEGGCQLRCEGGCQVVVAG